MRISEPTLAAQMSPVARYFLATRPAFLGASLVPVLIGLACARYTGVGTNIVTALVTILGALLVHAGINVLNDYYDALNGTDAVNDERIFPYTGGSRFIQNGVLSATQTARYGATLLLAGGLAGLLLLPYAGAGLLGVGALGLLLGWAYSAPPLSLNARGLGELSVAVGFGLLIPLGADAVQRGALSWHPIVAGAPYALLVANLLYINQFPDYRADAACGKRHWVVRLGPQRARWIYPALAGLAFALLIAGVAAGWMPRLALIALAPAVLSLKAARALLRMADRPAGLAPAIQFTIMAALAQGLLTAAALWNGRG